MTDHVIHPSQYLRSEDNNRFNRFSGLLRSNDLTESPPAGAACVVVAWCERIVIKLQINTTCTCHLHSLSRRALLRFASLCFMCFLLHVLHQRELDHDFEKRRARHRAPSLFLKKSPEPGSSRTLLLPRPPRSGAKKEKRRARVVAINSSL